jgi:hypothetical protein
MVTEKKFICREERLNLLECIAALHVLYHKYRSEILWFGQLMRHSSGILVHLTPGSIRNEDEMVIREWQL